MTYVEAVDHLDDQDYSWMTFLAEAGFDTFVMGQSAYGRASLEWWRDGTYRGQSTGIYRVGVDGAEPSGI